MSGPPDGLRAQLSAGMDAQAAPPPQVPQQQPQQLPPQIKMALSKAGQVMMSIAQGQPTPGPIAQVAIKCAIAIMQAMQPSQGGPPAPPPQQPPAAGPPPGVTPQ